MTVHAIRADGTCDVLVDLDPADLHGWTVAACRVAQALGDGPAELVEVEGVTANVEFPYFDGLAQVVNVDG